MDASQNFHNINGQKEATTSLRSENNCTSDKSLLEHSLSYSSGGRPTSQVNKLMIITNDTLKTIIMILVFLVPRPLHTSPWPGETFWDILKIHKWYSTENYANDIVLIKLNQQDKDKKVCNFK